MNKEDLYNLMNIQHIEDCIKDNYELDYDGVKYEYREYEQVYKDLIKIVKENFKSIPDSEKKSLEHKNLKVLVFNLAHLVIGNEEWNIKSREEAARLLYGIRYWILKASGPSVMDYIIKIKTNGEIVFLITQLFINLV